MLCRNCMCNEDSCLYYDKNSECAYEEEKKNEEKKENGNK